MGHSEEADLASKKYQKDQMEMKIPHDYWIIIDLHNWNNEHSLIERQTTHNNASFVSKMPIVCALLKKKKRVIQ